MKHFHELTFKYYRYMYFKLNVDIFSVEKIPELCE